MVKLVGCFWYGLLIVVNVVFSFVYVLLKVCVLVLSNNL